jgi:hypothetical protein
MTKNWIEIPARLHITGPAQMLRELQEHFPSPNDSDILFVWLTTNDFAVGIEQVCLGASEAEYDLAELGSPQSDECQKLIAVCRSATKTEAEEIANKYVNLNRNPLDVLIIAEGKWWSNLCTKTECCPNEGRPLPELKVAEVEAMASRHQKWLLWLNLLNIFAVNFESADQVISDEESLRKSLDDLAIRDCILNHLAINPETQEIWHQIFDKFLQSEKTHNNHVINCLIAAIYFSQGNLDLADKYTKNSLLINPDYSLALLMQHGLEIKMDCKKIVSAFTHFTSEELLKNTPIRI